MKTIVSVKSLRLMRSLTARLKQAKRRSGMALDESASTDMAGWDKRAWRESGFRPHLLKRN